MAGAANHIRIFPDMVQGGDDWFAARCGLLTASEMKLIVTPGTLKAASNDKERTHLYELMAQRVTKYVEPSYVSDDMLRGRDDEIEARELYSKTFAPVTEVGFMTNSRWGFSIGYSPDGLVGEDGLIECKGRRQKFQIQTIVDREIPTDFFIQVQTGLLVSERKWLDFISYCGGLPMVTIRAFPDPIAQAAILDAASAFERRMADKLCLFETAMKSQSASRLVPTERRVEEEMYL